MRDLDIYYMKMLLMKEYLQMYIHYDYNVQLKELWQFLKTHEYIFQNFIN